MKNRDVMQRSPETTIASEPGSSRPFGINEKDWPLPSPELGDLARARFERIVRDNFFEKAIQEAREDTSKLCAYLESRQPLSAGQRQRLSDLLSFYLGTSNRRPGRPRVDPFESRRDELLRDFIPAARKALGESRANGRMQPGGVDKLIWRVWNEFEEFRASCSDVLLDDDFVSVWGKPLADGTLKDFEAIKKRITS